MLFVLLKRLYIAIIVPYYKRLEKSQKKKKKKSMSHETRTLIQTLFGAHFRF